MGDSAFSRELIAVDSTSEANEFVAGPDRATFEKAVTIVAGNGTNNFGKIKAGTCLMRFNAGDNDKLYRPAFKATANGSGSGATTLNLNEDLTGNLLAADTLYFATQADTATITSITDVNTVEIASHTWDDNEVIYINETDGVARGFLRTTISTVQSVDADGTVTHTNRAARMVYRGAVIESRLQDWDDAVTASDTLKNDLQGHITFLDD